jgi:hypothetical protein
VPGGELAFTLLRGRTPLLGETDLPVPGALRTRLAGVIAGVVSGRGGADAVTLATFGVRLVVMPAPVDPAVRQALDSDPALTRVNLSESGGLWRMTAPLGRAYLLGQDGSRTPLRLERTEGGDLAVTVPPGAGERTLVLAEPAGGWTARASGASFPGTTVGGWAQGFTAPAAGGRVTIEHDTFRHDAWLWIQLALIALVLVLASPGSRGAEAVPEYADEPMERETPGVLVR